MSPPYTRCVLSLPLSCPRSCTESSMVATSSQVDTGGHATANACMVLVACLESKVPNAGHVSTFGKRQRHKATGIWSSEFQGAIGGGRSSGRAMSADASTTRPLVGHCSPTWSRHTRDTEARRRRRAMPQMAPLNRSGKAQQVRCLPSLRATPKVFGACVGRVTACCHHSDNLTYTSGPQVR
ncbi:hypothetical protein BHE74_00054002 [Ensete ventricosum]|nr:hypothetical protein BHE74_00054002 [Ensete ventricosum]RZS25057.1 hypothetical protein BHM03_00058212 [Ensete ventricosum]